MSKTPRTDNIARGNHVVPTEWAEQLERELDEARERERVAIAAWDEERKRALRESERVIEAREQNAKLRDIVERVLNFGGINVLPDSLLDELDQLKEGKK